MPKPRVDYVCQQCGYRSPQQLGRCPECGSWGSLVETIEQSASSSLLGSKSSRAIRMPEVVDISQLEKQKFDRLTTGIGEFDQVLGGGIVKGSVVLVSGDPGIGKSTLLTQLALNIRSGASAKQSLSKNTATDNLQQAALYVAGEESPHQIKIRVDRITPHVKLSVLNEVDVDVIVSSIEQLKPALAIVDSIQTLQTQDLTGIAGSVGQVRESAHRLQQIAKRLHIPIFIVGHVTKEGTIAGPKTLEHMVDVVLSLEGDPSTNLRVLRASKNRFGPTDEVGIFEMEEGGMKEITNPSELFLQQKVDAPGSAVVAVMSGYRPLLVEIQALVTKTFLPVPRRSGTGVDNNRLQILTAVLMKRLGLPLYDKDIFVNVTGGLKVYEPAADLAICMAIASSLKDKAIKPKTVLIGEVGLLGEVRNVQRVEKRKIEAKKLGYTNVVSPEQVKTLNDALIRSLVS